MPARHVTTNRLNVIDYGAIPNDENFDNYLAFSLAVKASTDNDEIFVPKGTYYFTNYTIVGNYYTHINLKSKTSLVGEGINDTVLVSGFSETTNQEKQTTVISVYNSNSITISDLSITSLTDDSVLPDPTNSSLQSNIFTAPKNAISIDSSKDIESVDKQTNNIYIRDVLMEKFQRMGVRLSLSREVIVENCIFQKAVNLGGGGAGYGISLQGRGNEQDVTDTPLDTVHNIVRNNKFVGPYLRHGALLQYFAHANLITKNSFDGVLLDAIDLHGEDEYSNEISYNNIKNTRSGAGIGVGNSGATHDAAGRNNFIYKNEITTSARGIDVMLGSPYTIIVENKITNLSNQKATAISLSDAPHTYISNNEITNVTGDDSYGIRFLYSFIFEDPKLGVPNNILISRNTFDNVKRGIFVETSGDDFVVRDNTFKGPKEYDYLNTKDSFEVPEKSTLMDPVIGNEVLPTDMNFITTETPNGTPTQKNLKLKSSLDDPHFNRMIYARFDISTKPVYEKVYLAFTAKAQIGKPAINLWGTTTYTNWTTETITWNNSLFHEPHLGKVIANENLNKIYDFKFPVSGNSFNNYYIEITDYILNTLSNDTFTMILSNDDVEESYMEIYNHLQVSSKQHFRLIFV